ncbi:MAG: type I restriction endonuclease subunit R [Bacteroidales bacterium]|nr:type I restriction endonuclease subunit R [Bacteroidales bacterium]
MSWEYSENTLVQESAGELLHDELGWDVVFAYNQETLGENGTLGRKSYNEVLLTRHLVKALRRLNKWMSDAQIAEALQALDSRLSTETLLQTNEKFYRMIRDGVDVTVKTPDGLTETRKAMLIDFNDASNNDFLAVKEMKIHGALHRRRTDIVGFVNGIPLLFVELKRNDVDVENAYNDNYRDYQDTIPQLFYYNAFVMLSNGEEAKVGTLGSSYEFFHEWKRLKEDDEGDVALETMLRGICKKENFLDIVENFILFDHEEDFTAKILAHNHQYLGVNEAVRAYKDRKLNEGKLGVFWHTQGSGKSFSMLFLSQKIRRKFTGSPTIVVVTDREELNKQISDTFANCGLLGKVKPSEYIASSGSNLLSKLRGNPSYIFTLIHKFNDFSAPAIIPDHDIIIMSDEAHRTQYGTLAENMARILPTASKIGFTGTPLFSNDDITRRTFGDYVSIYDFKRAVDDGATVPLLYENRGEKIKEITNPAITKEILDAIERADVDPDQEEKLEREFAQEIHLLTAEKRLRIIAKDFVEHYTDLWTTGKAMFVCLNKVTCVRMYNYAQEYWQEKLQQLKQEQKTLGQQEAIELGKKIKWMEETEMCVVISQEQNEIQTFQKWGLDITPHRAKMESRELDKEFRKPHTPFRVVFVCAMWLTGFDVKPLSCLYLDKPLKAHTLMQTIARANRVSLGKENGLIIDYVGIVKALRNALAEYTADHNGPKGTDPTIDKDKVIERVNKVVAECEKFMGENGFILQKLIEAKSFKKLALLKAAANAMCETQAIKKTFQTYAAEIIRLVKYLNFDDITAEVRAKKNAIEAVYKELLKKRKHVDITDLTVEINQIVNEYIGIENNLPEQGSTQLDLSKINFEVLQREFAKTKNKRLVMKDLQEVIAQAIAKILRDNPNSGTHIDFLKKYQELIEEYNGEQDRAMIERVFEELLKLSRELDEEKKRYIREGFDNVEELAMYDLLFSDNLSKDDIKKLKAVSVDLLNKLKEQIRKLDHWTDKEETQAVVAIIIRDTLWAELPEDCMPNFDTYRDKVYKYMYDYYKFVA